MLGDAMMSLSKDIAGTMVHDDCEDEEEPDLPGLVDIVWSEVGR